MTKPAPNLIKLSLFIFAIISFFYVFGNLSDSTLVMVISTTLVIPSLAFFYSLKSERILIYELILMLSWLGSVLILSNVFLYKISGIICFWGMILLLGYHILKELKEPLKIQLKTKKNFTDNSFGLPSGDHILFIRNAREFYLSHHILWSFFNRH